MGLVFLFLCEELYDHERCNGNHQHHDHHNDDRSGIVIRFGGLGRRTGLGSRLGRGRHGRLRGALVVSGDGRRLVAADGALLVLFAGCGGRGLPVDDPLEGVVSQVGLEAAFALMPVAAQLIQVAPGLGAVVGQILGQGLRILGSGAGLLGAGISGRVFTEHQEALHVDRSIGIAGDAAELQADEQIRRDGLAGCVDAGAAVPV